MSFKPSMSAGANSKKSTPSPPAPQGLTAPRADGAATKPLTHCRVLVADDEHLVATGIAGNVTDLGHTVVGVAPDGEAAVQMARDHHPDLALLDIRMPRLTGIDAAMLLYAELAIPSIIISAYSDQEHISKIHANGDAAGVFGYLLKPVTKDDLRVQIGVALQRAMFDASHLARIKQLEVNLANRRTVERAKWILVDKKKCSEPQAHEMLQKVARDRRKPLLEIAEAVIAAGDLV